MCSAHLCFRSSLENHVSMTVQAGTRLGNLKHTIYYLTNWLSVHKKLVLVNRILYLHVRCTTSGMIFYIHICACRYNRKDKFVTQNPGDRIWATLFFCIIHELWMRTKTNTQFILCMVILEVRWHCFRVLKCSNIFQIVLCHALAQF